MTLRDTAACVLAGLLLAGPLAGQTIRGRVLDAESGAAVPQAQVTALAGERISGRMVADTAGRFTLALRAAGAFQLRAERTGYQPSLSAAIEVGPRDTLEVELRISQSALRVEALTVTARRQPPRRPALDDVGFYTREAVGLGRFLHREDIEQHANMNLVQILDRLPGTIKVRVGRSTSSEAIVFQRSSNAGAIIRAQTGRPAHCLPKVYLDGNQMFYDEFGLNGMLQTEAIEAIEVYSSPSQVPPQFNSDASCGVILLWTKKRV